MKRRILHTGSLKGGETSFYRYNALQRLGHDVIPFDLRKYLFKLQKMNAIAFHFPMGPLVARINADLLEAVKREKPDVVWFDRPIQFTPDTVRRIKASGAQTVCYNQENPFGPRNDGCWYQFNRMYRMLDLHCLIRDADVPRYKEWGLNTIRTQHSYDPAQHFPPPEGWSDADRIYEVSYIGSLREDRPQFLRALFETHKLPLSIFSGGWEKVLTNDECRRYMRGGVLRDAEYRETIWKSKINLAFVTHKNEEDVAHKAFEIAACGSFLLALRTPGHEKYFEEGKEAEFFSSPEECAEKIRYYLDHPAEREEIAKRGCERAKRDGYDNDTQLKRIMDKLEELRVPGGKSAGA
jgi:glycosyltransferase involved in cell wall biosynthesis